MERAAAEPVTEDPFAIQGVRVHSSVVRLACGALAGSDAQLVVDPHTIPHIWALTSRLVVTVSGDLSRSELLEAAESLAKEQRP